MGLSFLVGRAKARQVPAAAGAALPGPFFRLRFHYNRSEPLFLLKSVAFSRATFSFCHLTDRA